MKKYHSSRSKSGYSHSFIEALKRGEPEAYYTLVEDHIDQLLHFLTSVVRDPDDAKDIAQDVFIYIWDNRDNLSEIRQLKNYIFSIAKHQALRKKADNQRHSDFPDDKKNESPHLSDSPEEIFISHQTKRELDQMIGKLPEMRRKIFILRYQEGRSYDEISALLNLKSSTIRTHFQLAVSQMRDLLSENETK